MESTEHIEDLHEAVLKSAFRTMICNPSRLLLHSKDGNELSLNRDVLVLFSPILRSVLTSVPCCLTPTIFLPDVSTNTILQLGDILNTGKSGKSKDVRDKREMIEAATQLGIDLSELHCGSTLLSSSEDAVSENVILSNKSNKEDQLSSQNKREGKVMFSKVGSNRILDPPASIQSNIENTSNSSTEELQEARIVSSDSISKARKLPDSTLKTVDVLSKTSTSNLISSVQIKKEIEDQDQSMDTNASSKSREVDDTTPPISNKSLKAKYSCEKCPKSFESLLMLRYHYCQHFRSILSKRNSNLIDGDKCLECSKVFPNSGKLLLHIGVQHSKIDSILEAKGIGGGSRSSLGSVSARLKQEADKTEESTNVGLVSNGDASNTFKTGIVSDLKHTELVTTGSEIKSSDKELLLKSPDKSAASRDVAKDKSKELGSECNYELICQVCNQSMKSLSLLEQHCCRHFMKELQDQFGGLIDGMKCTVCNSIFKQKGSLLLHIGCRHGKINDILRQKGFAALPCPVTSASGSTMQKQLIQIKKERVDHEPSDSSNNGPTFNCSNDSSRSEESSPSTFNLPRTLPNIQDIINKYKI